MSKLFNLFTYSKQRHRLNKYLNNRPLRGLG